MQQPYWNAVGLGVMVALVIGISVGGLLSLLDIFYPGIAFAP